MFFHTQHTNHMVMMESQSSQPLTPSLSSQQSLPSVPSLSTPSSSFNIRYQQPHNPTPAVNRHLCIATLTRRASQIFSLALSDKFLYSGCSNSEIRVWSHDCRSTDDDSLVATTSIGGPVKCLVVSGERIFSGHQDHKIRVWKIEHRNDGNVPPRRFYTCVATLPTFNDRFLKCFFPKNYVQVRKHRKRTWVHHVDAVSALATSADGSLLFSASWDRSFKVWRTSDYKCVASVSNAHDDAINAIVVSRDGVVYTGSADKKIKAWEIHARGDGDTDTVGAVKHALVDTMEAHKSAVNALATSHDGSVLYSGACDRSILVWEKDKVAGGAHMAVTGALRGHTKAILCLAATGSDLVCSGSADNTVRIWRRGAGKRYSCLATLEGHKRPVKCLAIGVDDVDSSNYLIYSGGLDGEIKMWRIVVPILL